jgi:E3 ubiquitin-protein ligase MARCH6
MNAEIAPMQSAHEHEHSSPMLNPSFDAFTQPVNEDNSTIENDTCRICRSEGSVEEPLFYPCKCSGSIKFVHQECLLEWLSHSHKKHCELCKTPFRFTKLYSPDMPERLPTPVFLRRAILHLGRSLLFWCRAALVASVWLFWLPWSMRFIFWGLFWVADHGWAANQKETIHATVNGRLTVNTTAILANSTGTEHEFTTTTLFSFARLQSRLKLLSNLLTLTDGVFGPNVTTSSNNVTTIDNTQDRHDQTLLSGFSFFRNLTSNQALNKFIIDILEGQIITLCVITAFVLVFLIREWVVQQQPGLQIGDPMAGGIDVVPPPAPMAADLARDPEDGLAGANVQEDTAGPAGSRNSEEALVEGVVFEQAFPAGPASVADPATQPTASILTQDRDANMTSPSLQSSKEVARDVAQSWAKRDDDSHSSAPLSPARSRSAVAGGGTHDGEGIFETREAVGLLEDDASDSNVAVSTDSSEGWNHIAQADLIGKRVEADVAFHADEEENNAPGSATLHEIPSPSSTRRPATPSNWDDESEPWENGSQESSVASTETGTLIEDDENVDDIVDQVHTHGTIGALYDWIFADLGPQVPEPDFVDEENDDDHRIQEHEEPFVPFHNAEPNLVARNEELQEQIEEVQERLAQAQDNLAAAAAAAEDIDAIEDAEDLEGVFELIGMQGPIAGLFQNAVFCALLISATVVTAVWFPYLWGKAVLLFLAHPVQLAIKVPLLFITWTSNFALDVTLWLGCSFLALVDSFTRLVLIPVGWIIPSLTGLGNQSAVGVAMRDVSDSALDRLSELLLASAEMPTSDLYHLSLGSHAALETLRSQSKLLFAFTYTVSDAIVTNIFKAENNLTAAQYIYDFVLQAAYSTGDIPQHLAVALVKLPEFLHPSRVVRSLPTTVTTEAKFADLVIWSATDRTISVLAGYGLFAFLGILYVRFSPPLTSSPSIRRVELIVTEVLLQAGGVLKVILIISIEMLAFPLYCGFLLDFAVLPLFNATIATRLAFTLSSPLASCFLHWFIGTCYMFHFALFVSMCRKLLRGGVLYFIRDPDDPTFHPVRDVLERNIATQLRKIGFSAMVYGALVILCMGSVVWATAYTMTGLFPVQWTSNMRFLEFPIDLLLYHTLTPLAVHLLKPASVLEVVYRWWFHKCGRALRMSHFLFNVDEINEQGRKTELDSSPVDGRWVRVPGSDQVRIPKGRSVFLEVDEDNKRLDGQEDDESDKGHHGRGNSQFQQVFIPPWFRVRIGVFVVCIWALTAVSGLTVTIIPLLFGRCVLSALLGSDSRGNDVHAFSIGVLAIASVYYAVQNRQQVIDHVKGSNMSYAEIARSAFRITKLVGSRSAAIVYTYSTLLFLIPALMAGLVECYLIMPLHAYVQLRYQSNTIARPFATNSNLGNVTISFADATTPSTNNPASSFASDLRHDRPHTIHALQSWTLGLLYTRILIRLMIMNYPGSRPARAIQAVVADGWLNPNARLATRCFILPLTVFSTLALGVPALLGLIARGLLANLDTEAVSRISRITTSSLSVTFISAMTHRLSLLSPEDLMRFTYPAVSFMGCCALSLLALSRALGRWRKKIRDEVYLVGERLHNYGAKDRKKAQDRRDAAERHKKMAAHVQDELDKGKGRATDDSGIASATHSTAKESKAREILGHY